MKRVVFLVLVLVLVMGASSSWGVDLAGFGSYSTTSDIGDTWGLGAKIDFNITELIFLEARGTYYVEYKETILEEELKVSAFPLEAGVGVIFGNLFASAGLSYFILDTDKGSMDDSAGFYLAGGM